MAYGYQAILELDGEKPIVLDNCSYTFVRDINEKTGEVQSGVSGGTISLTFIDHPSKDILEWAMKYKLKNGVINLRQTDMNEGSYIPAEKVTLSEAACVAMDFSYFRHGSAHFHTRLTVTCNDSAVGDADQVSKNWILT